MLGPFTGLVLRGCSRRLGPRAMGWDPRFGRGGWMGLRTGRETPLKAAVGTHMHLRSLSVHLSMHSLWGGKRGCISKMGLQCSLASYTPSLGK